MTICSHVRRIINAKAAIRAAIIEKGVDVPETDLIDKYAAYIDQISGTAKYYFNLSGIATNLPNNPHEAHGAYIDYGETINGYPAYSNKTDNNIKLYLDYTPYIVKNEDTGETIEEGNDYYWVIGRFTENTVPQWLFTNIQHITKENDNQYPHNTPIANPLTYWEFEYSGDMKIKVTLTAYTYSGGTGIYPGDADSDLMTEIYRIANAKAEMRTAIISKGVDVPESAMLEEYPDYIAQIQPNGGSSGEDTGDDDTGGDTGDDTVDYTDGDDFINTIYKDGQASWSENDTGWDELNDKVDDDNPPDKVRVYVACAEKWLDTEDNTTFYTNSYHGYFVMQLQSNGEYKSVKINGNPGGDSAEIDKSHETPGHNGKWNLTIFAGAWAVNGVQDALSVSGGLYGVYANTNEKWDNGEYSRFKVSVCEDK